MAHPTRLIVLQRPDQPLEMLCARLRDWGCELALCDSYERARGAGRRWRRPRADRCLGAGRPGAADPRQGQPGDALPPDRHRHRGRAAVVVAHAWRWAPTTCSCCRSPTRSCRRAPARLPALRHRDRAAAARCPARPLRCARTPGKSRRARDRPYRHPADRSAGGDQIQVL